jgi:hypothetical protein
LFQARLKTRRARTPAGKPSKKIRKILLPGRAVTAAALRHFLHVQVGLSREEIRNGVLLTAATGIFLLIAFLRWKRRP